MPSTNADPTSFMRTAQSGVADFESLTEPQRDFAIAVGRALAEQWHDEQTQLQQAQHSTEATHRKHRPHSEPSA